MGDYAIGRDVTNSIPEPDGTMGAHPYSASFSDRQYAETFMRQCGLVPTPDAIDQLADAFLPCLRIMCERPYDPEGATWRAEGWRGMIWKGRDKVTRLWYNGWTKGRFVHDDPLDGINYLGFYYRLRSENGSEWGERGAPGS